MKLYDQYKLLVVDDEPQILKAVKRALRGAPYSILLANNGEEALEVLAQNDIAVVLSDMKMPNMNGAKLLSIINERSPETIGMILTGYADIKDTISAINNAGVFRYINKPWDNQELAESVENAFALFESRLEESQGVNSENLDLKNRNEQLEKEVQKNIAELDQANDKLVSAREDEKKLRDAENLSEAKSRFLATMSHEMRSPLNAVISMNSLLLKSGLSKEQSELAQLAHDGGQTLLGLINDVLDFSKLEAGKLELHREWFNIIELTESVTNLMASQIGDRPIEIATVIKSGTPMYLEGDHSRVRQILTNVISNAVKFTEQGGVHIKISPLINGIEISVKDTGIGMSSTEQEKIFDDFFQADNSVRRSYGGTGLGLSISKNLISMMKGKITLTSRPGKGSCFGIFLPLKSKSPVDTDFKMQANTFIFIQTHNHVLFNALYDQLNQTGICVASSHNIPANVDRFTRFIFLQDIENTGKNIEHSLDCIENAFEDSAPELVGKPWETIALAHRNHLSDREKIAANGFHSSLCKPIQFNDLQNMLQHDYLAKASTATAMPSDVIEPTPPAAESQEQNFPQILLAEDSPSNQAVVKAILSGMPYTLHIANNGEEAVALAQDKAFSIILMDLAMPHMDGITATKHIRSHSGPNTHTPIVAMTANAFAEDKERCFANGMNHYMSKPINMAQFLEDIETWTEPHHHPDQAQVSAPHQMPTPTSTPTESVEPNTPAISVDQQPKSLIDIAVLHQLIRDTSASVLAEILEIYFRETQSRITQIQKAFKDKAWDIVEDQAHTLKSSSGSFGATHLYETSKTIEHLVHAGKHGEIDSAINGIDLLAENTIAQLKDFLAQHSH